MSEYRENLKAELKDEEYRYAYAEDFLNTAIAMQIKVLREQRKNMTQQALAEKIGTKQAGISRLENVNYSAWKTETLRKLARAFGVRLKITFEEFGSLLDDSKSFSRESLQRRTFEEDPAFQTVEAKEIEDSARTNFPIFTSRSEQVKLPLLFLVVNQTITHSGSTSPNVDFLKIEGGKSDIKPEIKIDSQEEIETNCVITQAVM